jgi:hypothetical protein
MEFAMDFTIPLRTLGVIPNLPKPTRLKSITH